MSSTGTADSEPAEEKGAGGAQTLLRGLDVLTAVAERPVTLPELAARIGLTRSTAHRLASALVDRRFLSFRPREGYSLGPKLLELGYCARQQLHITQIARPILEQLSEETGDAVHLGVMEEDKALYLDKVAGNRRVLIGSRVGERHPIASTGIGKALVLDLGEARWRELFPAQADGTVNAGQLSVWLERMRSYAKAGYAFDLEENEDQIRCVAAPVRDVDGKVIASISVSSAAQYMDDERMQTLVPTVQAAADAISRELGWTEKVLDKR